MKIKQLLLIIIFALMVFIPFNAQAEETSKANIYLFRGEGCPHCEDFLDYIANLDSAHQDMINVVKYEVWNNTTNASLMQTVAKYFNETVSGVPYIIIGDKTYSGYSSSMASEITEAIENYYNSTNRFDLATKVDLTVGQADSAEPVVTKANVSTTAIVVLVGIVIIGGAGLIYIISKSNNN